MLIFFRLLAYIAILAFQLTPAIAGLHLHGSAANSALSGVVGFAASDFPFVNFAKSSQTFFTNTGTTFVYPNFMQAGSNLPTGTLPGGFPYLFQVPSNYFGKYVLANIGTVSGTSEQLGQSGQVRWGQVYSVGGGTTLSGCSNGNVPPCYFGNRLNLGGTNPTVTFDLSAPITGAVNNGSGLIRITYPGGAAGGETVTISGVIGSDGNGCGTNGTFTLTVVTGTTVDLIGSTFAGGCTYSFGGQMWNQQSGTATGLPFTFEAGTYTSLTSTVICKLADYNADSTCNTTAGKTSWLGGFNDDFVASLATILPHHIRFLDSNNIVFGIPPDWNNWPSSSLFNYDGPYYAINNWFGNVSGTNSYAVTCSTPCTYTLTAGVPKDGDFFQFFIANANTNANPTLTITDINSVTSAVIPLMTQGYRIAFSLGGSVTVGNTVALQFNSSCLSGGTHTTTAHTVVGGDTLISLTETLAGIINADTTLTAQPAAIIAANPNGGSGTVYYGYASNACSVTASLVVGGTGSPTETITLGTMPVGSLGLAANTIYTGIYNQLHNAIIVNINDLGGSRGAWPWSVQVALAKAVSTKAGKNVGCWLQPNILWSATSFTSFVNYVNSNQCPGGSILEVGNEVWNPGNSITGMSASLATSIGIPGDAIAYYELRQRQFWGIASSIFGGLSGNLYTTGMFQLSGINSNEIQGTMLCGMSCGNTAYQNAIGVDYNAIPNRPIDFTRVIGQAPYYQGAILNGFYQSSGNYGSWSATNSSVSSSVLTVGGTVTGTIWWNQGISSCEGAYLAAPIPINPSTVQLTGTVTKTVNGSFGDNTSTFTLNNTTNLQVGMWIYDQNTGMVNGTIASINPGANQITAAGANKYRSATSSDTFIFGGKAGTYQLNSMSCSASSGTITGGDILGLQYAADNYNGINGAIGSQQDAFNWIYQDLLVAVSNNNLFNVTTIQSMINAYNIINGVASSFNVPVWDYEGGYQTDPVSAANATLMGLPSAAYGYSNFKQNDGYIYNLNNGFKNSVSFKNLEILRHNNELASLPLNSMTMWFNFEGMAAGGGPSQWGLFSGDLYAPAPYQSYNAICAYNGGNC